jgi:hypothetical protein
MKKLNIILFFLAMYFCSQLSFSYDSVAAKYYPLAVGNTWTYSGFGYPCCGAYKYREKITGTINTNGHFYFIMTTTQHTGSSVTSYIRLDSTKGMVYIYEQGGGCPWLQNERAKDSLSARKGDSSRYNCESMFYYRCTDTTPGVVFGTNKQKKVFSWTNYFEAGGTRTFAKDIGLIGTTSFAVMSTNNANLVGCYIGGVLYGDTTLTGINLTSSEVPGQFSLSQNYPNPFNPATNIRFDLPTEGTVKLTIFDALGKEVQTLVNQQLPPGEYSVDFNGSNLPSGVYYYRIESGSFSETKKMVLIK